MGDQVFQGLVLLQPFCRRFRADFRYAGNIVDGVAYQGQVVDNLFRLDPEFVDNALNIHARVGHGVFKDYMFCDQLRHILVAGGNNHVIALLLGVLRQGSQHIVGFHAGLDNQRQTHRTNQVVQRGNLHPQIIRHGRSMGFVLIVKLIAKGFTRCIEDHGDVVAVIVGDQFAQHIADAVNCVGGFAVCVG